MSILTTPPLAQILDALFRQDAAASAKVKDLSWSKEEVDRLKRSKTEYRAFYGSLKEFPLAVSRETGLLLYMLACGCRARSIVEFGTSFGVSTLFLAAALRDNGGGHLISSEFEPTKVAQARENLKAAGLLELVDVRAGDALQTLSVDLPETIDLMLLDGSKALYPDILALTESRLRPGALVIADDADCSPEYIRQVRTSGGYLSVPLTPDVELSMRLG
ncbi:MAG: class I SAM-dependent methyltransferase [Deltaproteobacteria bacterium]|jgi:predicted O-methyltransferase YrrM|nr:class I SAM-dependent methyltransferase [Deltaproteobacteria bacterium]